MSEKVQNRQQQLIKLIDNHSLDEFLIIYRQSLCSLRPFEHIKILLYACRFGTLEFVHNMLNEKSAVSVNCRHPSTGYAPLFIAIRAKRHNIIKYLIEETEADVNWNSTNNENQEIMKTCLHEALRQRDVSTVKLLLQHGATVDERHLYVAIGECFRQEFKETTPLIMFETLLADHSELLEENGRIRLIEFIQRRANWLTTNHSQYISSLFRQLLFKDDFISIDNTYFKELSIIPRIHRTQVAIIGAGPAGLMLGALLWRCGIDSVILEQQSRSNVETNIRAGVLEQSTIDLLDEVGVSDRLFRQSIVQSHINFQFDGERMSIPIVEMTQGRVIVVYGQQNVLQDLIKARIDSGQRIFFDVEHVHIERHDTTDSGNSPLCCFRRRGHTETEELHSDFIAGCDGARSQCCRESIPNGVLHTIEKTYPFAWLSILAEVLLVDTELIYADHSKYGFALQSFRSPVHNRFHLQIPLGDTLADWPDERIWNQLELRLTPNNQAWTLAKGTILERAIFPLRSSVTLPMQYKRLFLVGDAAHIFPPTGAKGLNVAAKDAKILADSIIDFYENGRYDKLTRYTTSCSSHVWQTQEFANYMTLIMHNFNISNDKNSHIIDEFEKYLQQARRRNLQQSQILQHYIADMYAMGIESNKNHQY